MENIKTQLLHSHLRRTICHKNTPHLLMMAVDARNM
jgi:hypothetical protein